MPSNSLLPRADREETARRALPPLPHSPGDSEAIATHGKQLAGEGFFRPWFKALLLLTFSFVLTSVLQYWVGRSTIYSHEFEEQRLAMHRAILVNQPPFGAASWQAMGAFANGLNMRIGVVYLVEAMHVLTGWRHLRIYYRIDSVCLFATFIVLFVFLRNWFDVLYSAVGVLYLAFLLQLTYFLHDFHPWDRLSSLFWILLLWALCRRRYWTLCCLLPLSLVVKMDTIVLPGIYWLSFVQKSNWREITARSAFLSFIGVSVIIALNHFLPGGTAQPSANGIARQMMTNVLAILSYGYGYQPLLVLLLTVPLAAVGACQADRVVATLAASGLALNLVAFMFSNYYEVRNQVPLILMLLPAALLGVELLVNDDRPRRLSEQSRLPAS